MTNRKSKYQREGSAAFKAGKSIMDNPYLETHSYAASEWKTGFQAAQHINHLKKRFGEWG